MQNASKHHNQFQLMQMFVNKIVSHMYNSSLYLIKWATRLLLFVILTLKGTL